MNFEYNEVTLPEDAKFKISPSSISKFFDLPSVWYEEHIKDNREFIGSTATVLGTIIHALAEAYALGEPHSKVECDNFIDKMALEIEELNFPVNPNDDIEDEEVYRNSDKIKELYPEMAKVLINDYIRMNTPTEVEEEVFAHIENGVYVGGTCDNRTGSTVVDYKNVSVKPKTDKIPFGYLIQMLAYAYAYRAQGVEIDRVRLVYTVRPTKTLGIRLFEVNHVINEDDWKMIEDTLALIADTVQLHWARPELDYIVFKSMRLKD